MPIRSIRFGQRTAGIRVRAFWRWGRAGLGPRVGGAILPRRDSGLDTRMDDDAHLVAVHAARAEERAEGRLAHDLLETAQREPERASHVAELVGGGERAARGGADVAAAGPTTRASHRRRERLRGRRVAAEEARRAGRGGGARLRAMTTRPDGDGRPGRRGARVGPRAGSRGRSRERGGRRDGRRRHRTNDA